MPKKVRLLVQVLILSAALNALLIGLFFYFLVRESPLHFAYAPKKVTVVKKEPLDSESLNSLRSKSYDSLIALLEDRREAKEGYLVRDFALAALYTYHHFDPYRGLQKSSLETCRWEELTFFFHLSDAEFEQLLAFNERERYPFTLEGLFKQLESSPDDRDLLAHLCQTPPFLQLQTLFNRTGLPIQKGTLLKMVSEGGWHPLADFDSEQKMACDFSARSRQRLLVNYLESGSKTAAYLLLITDPDFALKQLTDRQAHCLIELLDTRTQEAVGFLTRLAGSPRDENLIEKAEKRLIAFGQKRPAFLDKPPAAPDPRVHVIARGESLWLIAKKYHVSLEELKRYNQLKTDVLQPGKTLKIPPPN